MDGRNARVARTKAITLAACRELMAAGDFRPLSDVVAAKAGISKRSIFQHFLTVEALHLAAIEDHDTYVSIAARVLPDVPIRGDSRRRMVRAIVLGKVEAA